MSVFWPECHVALRFRKKAPQRPRGSHSRRLHLYYAASPRETSLKPLAAAHTAATSIPTQHRAFSQPPRGSPRGSPQHPAGSVPRQPSLGIHLYPDPVLRLQISPNRFGMAGRSFIIRIFCFSELDYGGRSRRRCTVNTFRYHRCIEKPKGNRTPFLKMVTKGRFLGCRLLFGIPRCLLRSFAAILNGVIFSLIQV
jgi:hypothetical protein